MVNFFLNYNFIVFFIFYIEILCYCLRWAFKYHFYTSFATILKDSFPKYPHPHTWIAFPIINFIHKNDTLFFYYNEPTLKWSEVAQSCATLCNPMDCSLPGSSIQAILQARVLEWVAISFSREASQPGDWTWVSHISGRCFTLWATREAKIIICFSIFYIISLICLI